MCRRSHKRWRPHVYERTVELLEPSPEGMKVYDEVANLHNTIAAALRIPKEYLEPVLTTISTVNNKVILLDVDGVLADFTGAVLQIGNAITGLDKRPADVTRYGQLFELYPEETRAKIEELVSTEGFCSGLQVYKGAKHGVAELREFGRVYAVTSPWHSKTWCFERTCWLKAHFGMHDGDVIHASEKHLVRGDMMVEDHPIKLAMWQRVNPEGLSILVNASYNQDASLLLHRVRTWDEILAAAKGHFIKDLG